jgi:hypothetical protein
MIRDVRTEIVYRENFRESRGENPKKPEKSPGCCAYLTYITGFTDLS